LLARRFEQEEKAGRRISRLAPLTIQHEFGNRSGYFSSLSNSNSPSEDLPPPPSHPGQQPQNSPRAQTSTDKHKSLYPMFGGDDEPLYEPPMPYRNVLSPIGEQAAPPPPRGYFDIPRSMSPEPAIGLQEATPVSPNVPRSNSHALQQAMKRQQSLDAPNRQHSSASLRPPRSPGSQRTRSPKTSPTVRSVQNDSADEVEDMSLGGSYDSLRRNLSPSSSQSRSHSPLTPFSNQSIPRSPSASSERSTASHQLPRPAFANFSRPRSSTSIRPSLDLRPSMDRAPSRQASDESAQMRPSLDNHPVRQDSAEGFISPPYANDVVHTPVSMTSEDWRRSTDYSNQAGTYTYSKFDLPRGRKLDRKSIGIEDFLNSQISWEQPKKTAGARPPSPVSPPRSASRQRPSIGTRNTSAEGGAPSLTSSNSTIRGTTGTGSDQITAQEHCDKGVELHEAGELLKSTYHFRLAARAGLAEGMFWYGLACRHGWGMRVNQAEAFQWLRRAVDSGQLEIAEDEDQTKHGQRTDLIKKKQHKAQYGVAIYELGKCYMNGWGAKQDKSLAVRCYEIAGNWGDADALVEAGYCYAEGVGCRKDMKKAAKFYRAAEAKGVSMVGNSWIYKDKYVDDSTSTSDTRSVRSGRSEKKDPGSAKKSREKSRTRTIFGRKKSFAT
jgi:TPR repeat protein